MSGPEPERFNLPNAITLGRLIVAAPSLLACAVSGWRDAFVWVLALAFLSDAADGMLARLRGQTSRFGAMLDSWADAVVYVAIAIGVTLLWPDLVRAERAAFAAIAVSFLAPVAFGVLRFGRFTSYHTWLVKLAVGVTAGALLIALWGGPPWLLRLGAALAVVAALEEIAISCVLDTPRSNVRSLRAVWRARRRGGR